MAKKKTTKTSAKKKSAAKSNRTEDKTKKSTAKKAKQSAAKKGTAQKTNQSKIQKKSTVKKKTVSLKELLMRQFEKPDNTAIAPASNVNPFESVPESPPFFDTNDSKKIKKLKSLLLQKIDMTDMSPPKKQSGKKAVAKPKKTVSVSELLKKKFAVKPKDVWIAPQKKTVISDSPPFVDISDSKEFERIRSLLFQKIDMTQIPAPKVVEERKPKPKPEPPKPKPVIPISQLIKKTFSPWSEIPIEPAPTSVSPNISDAPPFIEGSSDEIKRIKALLLNKIDMTDIPAPVIEKEETTVDTKPEEITQKVPVPKPKEEATTDEIQTEITPEKEIAEEKIPVEKTESNSVEKNQPVEQPVNDVIFTDDKKDNPIMSNSLKLVFAGVLVLFFMMYMASSSNYKKFYLLDGKSGVELWQGDFSPMGKSHVVTLRGMELPEDILPEYTKSEVYPLVCAFFLDRANEILSQDSIPNLDQVKESLEQAYEYADEKARKEIEKRLNGIDFMMFVLRADLAIQKGSSEDLKKAKEYIKEAQGLAEKNYQTDMIKKRLQLLETMPVQKKETKLDEPSKEDKNTAEKQTEPTEKSEDSHH